MFYIDNDSGVTVMPPVSAQRSAIVRWFSEGDGNNVITWPGMDWFNIVQAELLNTLAEAGIQPDKTKLNQLALSIKAIMSRNALLKENNLSEIKAAGASAQRAARENLDIYDASLSKKGLVQLTSATDSISETLAATAKAVKIVMDNANARLAKDRNGADIPNKPLFIQNVGLQPTVDNAAGAVQRGGDTMSGKLNLPQTSAFGVNTDNALGGNSIVLGDNDTGFKQNGDGILDVYANSQHVFRFVAGIINSLRSLRIEGYITATGGVYEANGSNNVRVYSPNNPPPAPNLSAYATRDWVLQNTVQDIDHTAPIEVQFFDGRGYPRGTDGAAMHNISFVGGYSNVGWIQFRYTRKRVNGTWYTIA